MAYQPTNLFMWDCPRIVGPSALHPSEETVGIVLTAEELERMQTTGKLGLPELFPTGTLDIHLPE